MTDITSLLAGTPAGAGVTLTPGAYSISTSVNFQGNLVVESGAVITIPSGAVLNFYRGDLDAPHVRIFAGAGTVNMNESRIATAYAEWWGADPYNGAFDNR